MTFQYLKFDYLKNEESFRHEIKRIILVLQVLSFRHTKQTSKNVADTTFNIHIHSPAQQCIELKV